MKSPRDPDGDDRMPGYTGSPSDANPSSEHPQNAASSTSRADSGATQTALAGLGGVRLDLFDGAWFTHAAKAPEPEPEQSAEAAEVDEIDADLQQSLPLSGERLGIAALGAARRYGKYKCPELAHLVDLPWERTARAYCEHPEDCEYVAAFDTETLIDRVEWLHVHRSRGLSELDFAIQREWTVRALGTGYFYGRQDPWLPTQLVHLAGRRSSVHRRLVLAALCLSMVRGNVGICISAPEAFKLWGIWPSTWWRAIAWLEDRGLLVRMRRWKNNEPSDNPDEPPRAPVQLCPNWYGPGPELVEQRAKVLAAFGVGDEDDVQAAHDAMVEQRRERARELRRRALDRDVDHTPPGQPAPAWVLAVATSAYLSRLDDWVRERARALVAGTFDVTVEGVFDPEPYDPEPELGAELEQLAELELEPRDLRALAADVDDAKQAAVADTPAPRVLAHGGPTDVVPVSREGRPTGTITVPFRDGSPQETETELKGPAVAETGTTSVGPPCASTRGAGVSATAAGTTSATPAPDAWSRLDFDEQTEHPCPFDDWLAAKRSDNRAPPKASDGARAPALEGDGRGPNAPPGGGVVREAARSELGRAVEDVAKRNPELARMLARCLLNGRKVRVGKHLHVVEPPSVPGDRSEKRILSVSTTTEVRDPGPGCDAWAEDDLDTMTHHETPLAEWLASHDDDPEEK